MLLLLEISHKRMPSKARQLIDSNLFNFIDSNQVPSPRKADSQVIFKLNFGVFSELEYLPSLYVVKP